tara:strand:- start:12172 stop:12954 length:783 start_codon:yes stop_codon:yes gene_type:complete
MLKKSFPIILLALLFSCNKEIPKINIEAKAQERFNNQPIDKSDYKSYTYGAGKKKLNGYVSTYNYHNKLIEYGGYIEGKKHGEHKYYDGKDNFLYKIEFDENTIIDQTIEVNDTKGNPLYNVEYKNGEPYSFVEKAKIGLPVNIRNQIIMSKNRWFITDEITAIGDFNSDNIQDFALKYRDDYKYRLVIFMSYPRTNTWVTISQNDYKNKEVLNGFNRDEENPLGVYLEKIEGTDCLNDGNGTIIYFDEVENAFKYYIYD